MSTRKRRDPRSLEPEAPSLYEEAPSKRPPTGQRPLDLDAVIGNAIGTVLLQLIASGREERHRAPPQPSRVDGSKVDAAPFVMRTCGNDGHYLCGARMASSSWVFCPYCAAALRAVQ